MLTYAVRTHCINSKIVATFNRLVETFNKFPDAPVPEEISCHAVCRALFMLYEGQGFYYVDGVFGRSHNHSWLDFGNGIIADMYPVAGCNPFLVDASVSLVPWNSLYTAKDTLFQRSPRELERHERNAKWLVDHMKQVG